MFKSRFNEYADHEYTPMFKYLYDNTTKKKKKNVLNVMYTYVFFFIKKMTKTNSCCQIR